jgi:hypothetical protein
MAQTQGINLPPPQTPFVDPSTGILSQQGYQYFVGLLTQIAQSVATATLSPQVAASGNNQATATQLTSQWNLITAGAADSGVLLSIYNSGQSQIVFNSSGETILIYPPPGYQIDALGDNAAYSLANATMQIFNFVSTSQIETTQLG